MSEHHWLEITLVAHTDEAIAQIEAALEEAGAIAITYVAADQEEIFEPEVGTTPMWQNTKITGLFSYDAAREEILNALEAALGSAYPLREHWLADSDWTRAWLDYFQPIAINPNFWIAASEHQIHAENATVLRLDPGLAFGTGTHPSTYLCLELLANRLNLKNKTVYDYGCGSGILGIAAALLGAQSVYQTDIDPQALTASKDNAIKNKVLDKIVVCADPCDAPAVDVIVANILLEPLCALKPAFERHLKAGSVLYFAGLLARQEAQIRQTYGQDYDIVRLNERDGWILLALTPTALSIP